MEGTKNIKIIQGKQTLYLGLLCGGLLISVFGWWLGFTNFNPDSCQKDENNCKKQVESLRIVVIPITLLIIGGSFVSVRSLLNWYFGIIEGQLDLEAIQKRHKLERDISSEYR